MKKITLFLLIGVMVGLTGCSKDADVNAFITEFDAATQEIVTKIDANPTGAGVDDAQKAFDARKPALKVKWDSIKNAVGFQVSADTKKKLEDSTANNVKSLMDVSTKNAMSLGEDKEASAKFQALMNDYQKTFSMDN